MYNILIGGAAGQGVETTASVLEKVLKLKGYNIFTTRDYMSRVRGGHNFIQIRFGPEELTSHAMKLDGIIALNEETIGNHLDRLSEDGFIISNTQSTVTDKRLLPLTLHNVALESGNSKAAGSVAVGAVLKLYSETLDQIEDTLKEMIKAEFLEANLKACRKGFDLVESKFKATGNVADNAKKMLMNGNEAIALGAIAAGLKFYSAYPMTPSTSIMTYIASKMEECGIVVEQAEDEIAGINMAIGASYAGVKAMTGTSGGGFSLKVEALGLSGMAEIPLVVANIQRPGPVTGLPTRTEQSDLKFVISASQGEFPRMVIAVRNPQDAFFQTVRAFNIAEKYQIPVIILGDQFHADTTVTVSPFDLSKVTIEEVPTACPITEGAYKRYEVTPSGISPRIIPGRCEGKFVEVDSDEHDEFGRITESSEVRISQMDKRMRKLKLLEQELLEPEFFGADACETLLIGWGSMEGPLKEAVSRLNALNQGTFGALVFGDIYPLPKKLLLEKSAKASKVINVEQNATGQLGGLVAEYAGVRTTHSILKYDGRQLSADEIVERISGGIK